MYIMAYFVVHFILILIDLSSYVKITEYVTQYGRMNSAKK